MIELLRPRYTAPSVLQIDLEHLKRNGIHALVLDLDNTLVEWGVSQLRPELVAWIGDLKAQGFKLCILSNGMYARVEGIARQLDVPFVSRAVKPRRRAFLKALAELGTECGETAVVGDQLFTDVLGGNRCRLYTVLTPPLSEREFIYTRLVRKVERLVLKYIRRMGTS